MEKRKQFRQGDVFIEQCDRPRGALAEVKPDDKGRTILAFGEVTGHAHALSSKTAKLYEVKGWVERLLVVTKVTALMHEEHGRIELPPGNYKVRIQKEYHPEEIRNVAD